MRFVYEKFFGETGTYKGFYGGKPFGHRTVLQNVQNSAAGAFATFVE